MAESVMEFDFRADDDTLSEVSAGEIQTQEVDESATLSELRDAAENVQRLQVTRLQSQHMLGRMHVAGLVEARRFTDEKLFHVPRYIKWLSGNPDVVVDALRLGRVRARVAAAAGTGKTVKLAPYLANELKIRVCLVGHDARLLNATKAWVKKKGLGRYTGHWSRRPGAKLVAMTYADFNGFVASQDRPRLFQDFEVFVFDEAGFGNADVFVAKRNFAAYSLEGNSLLLCSATISGDSQEHGAATGLGNVKTVASKVSLEDAMASGKLVKEYLTDRTLVLLPGDQAIWKLAEYYRVQGVDVRTLDTAATSRDVEQVVAWMEGDTSAPRVCVAHDAFGLGHNLPVSFVLTWPERQEWQFVDGVFQEVVVPHSPEMVLQHVSRAGRGLVDGAGALVMSPATENFSELYPEHRMRAFVMMHACYLRPLRNGAWQDCYDVFPKGLPAKAALNVMKVALPVEVTCRYLGPDGQIAAMFVQAVMAFAQPDHFLFPSESQYPVGYDSWREEVAGGYGESEPAVGGVPTVKVPFEARGEMRVVLHALYQMSQGKVFVPRWRPRPISNVYDPDEYSDDDVPTRSFDKLRLRRIEDAPLPESPVKESAKVLAWQYESSLEELPARKAKRRARYIENPEVRQALAQLDGLLMDYKVPDAVAGLPEVESDTGEKMKVVTVAGVVESPGGSAVCELPVPVCEKMNQGEALQPDEFLGVLSKARVDPRRFVASKLFDCFAGPWDSVLLTLLLPDVVNQVVKKGAATDTYRLVGCMQDRFREEVVSVLSTSNVFKRTYWAIFSRRVTMDAVMRQLRERRFHSVAQTDAFVQRVIAIKDRMDSVLLFAEHASVFLPTHITAAQRGIPFRGRDRLGVVGQDLRSSPFAASADDQVTERLRSRLNGDASRGWGPPRWR